MPSPGNPQSLNRYSYALNNPVRYTDPTGHYAFEEDPDDPVSFGTNIRSKYIRTHPNYNERDITGGEIVVGATAPFWVAAAAIAGGEEVGELANIAHWGIKGLAKLIVGAACGDGDCTNEANAALKTVQYDTSMAAGEGVTDKFGNITISPHGSLLDRLQALYHEQVHSFFTPRGLLQATRADISMQAYQRSHLLRYAEEAFAESVAQLRTGGSLQTGLLFPIANGYVSPWRVALEGGILIGGTYWTADKLVGGLRK